MTDAPVRFRLAPSPTGYMHIGTLRTALYNYLYVQRLGGQFVLRIEDTDQQRYVEGAVDAIYDGLAWAHLTLDEGPKQGGPYAPYIQSERSERHRQEAERLVAEDKAYRCFCTKERLAELKELQAKHGLPPQYDRKCRHRTAEEVAAELAKGTPYTIRIKMPLEGQIICEDEIRGKLVVEAKDQDDCILMKTDGFATYHLAAMVDDYDMRITHVVRTDEWLPSYAKHVVIIQALGYPQPKFAHPPIVLNEDRTKLSKRKGNVAVSNYIAEGYLREALLNFLILLGWSPQETNRELFTIEELIQEFDFSRVSTAPAIFKTDKLDWFNGQYIRSKSVEELEKDLIEYLEYMQDVEVEEHSLHIPSLGQHIPKATFRKMVTHAQQKMVKLKEFIPGLAVYFSLPDYDAALFLSDKMKVDNAMAKTALEFLEPLIQGIDEWTLDNLKNTIIGKIAEAGYKNGQILWPMRVALSGLPSSPGAFEMADVLGKEETLRRLTVAMERL